MSVRLSVCVVDHALTAEPIDFIFGMHIDVIPRSDIGILDIQFLIIKDHLWTKSLLCDVPLHFQCKTMLAVEACVRARAPMRKYLQNSRKR